jgi:3-hydroxyisobutyrate dehydrogenase-like beta-hydroxyacid dehydrogenase
MCKCIVEKANLDSPLMIHNRTTQRAVDLSQKLGTDKTKVIQTLTDGASKADIIFMCLSKDDVVESTITQILTTDIKGKLIIDCSTIHPDTTTRISERILSASGEFVAAPVFGAPPMAEAGLLVGVLAGPASSVQKAQPYFKGVMSRADILMADEPVSKATTLKIIGNTFVLNLVEQLAEGHVLAEKTGLGTGHLHSLMENLFPGIYAGYSGRMVSGDYYRRDEPLFDVDLARKDAAHAMSLAKAAGTRVLNVETADRHLQKVQEHAGKKGDLPGIYGAVREEAGLKFENDA